MIHTAPDFRGWDVVHVAGYRPLQRVKAAAHLRRAREDAALAIGERSGEELMRAWDAQRDRQTVFVRQIQSCTIGSVRLESAPCANRRSA